jgi:hypothetical protein
MTTQELEDLYPPAILFDGFYAGVILSKFGTPMLIKAIQNWKKEFNRNGPGVTSRVGAELKKLNKKLPK